MPITPFGSNSGGLNLSDSPLTMRDSQATGQSYNYDYLRTGAISKILGHAQLNTVADAQLRTLGMFLHHSVSTDARTCVRAGGTKIQTTDTTTGSTTNQTDDTVSAATDFWASGSTVPVVSAQFNTLVGGTVLWMAGGGANSIYGWNGTNVTANGTPAPTGTFSLSLTGAGTGGTWASTGTYFWGLALRKRATQTVSNVALDVSINVDDVTKKVTVTLPSVDTTKYDKFLIYRSAVSGVTGFTTGSLVTTIDSSSATYTDNGSSAASAQVVPRAGNSTDNSVLSSGNYKSVTAFKRRLVTALGSTFYISDLDKPESWPIANAITIPTGGPITALGVIGTNSEYTTGADEYLCIWKERELWVLTGDDASSWVLKYVDKTGAVGQAAVVNLNGFTTWMAYNGVYAWDGKGRPARVSRPINILFEADGDIDKTKLSYAWGAHFEKMNEVVWRVSHRTKGEQKYTIKLDTRLTALSVQDDADMTEADGVFIVDTDNQQIYGGCSFRPSASEELFLTGDGSGYVYSSYSSASNPGSTGISFQYETKPLDMGAPQRNKRFKRVLVWVERLANVDLTLNYWADYRNRAADQSYVKANLAPNTGKAPALWDVAYWDLASWDDYTVDISIVEFQLHAYENNVEGETLKLQFQQSDANAPVRIHAFAVEWEDLGDLQMAV